MELPREQPYARAVFHLFVVRHPRRDALAAALRERGVGTLIHYPIPLHLQPAFASLGGRPGDLPVAEKATAEILSLPLYPELTRRAGAGGGGGGRGAARGDRAPADAARRRVLASSAV